MSSPFVATRSQVSPVGEAIEAGRSADGGCADGIECVPDADGGHGLGVRWRAGFVDGLGDDGEDAIAANREGEPVGLADLAETAAPETACGHGARLSFGADGVVEAGDWTSRMR